MNEKDWEILITLQEEGSITKAAEKMYMSQPALTYRIRQLEQNFNCVIILRGNKGVIFTPEGEYLVSYARKMIRELTNVKNGLNNLGDTIQGVLRIGVANIFAFYRLPILLEGFLSIYPNVDIHLTSGWSYKILKLLQGEDIHVAIVRGEHNWTEGQIVLDQEPICVAARDKISLDDLPKLNWIKYYTDAQLLTTFDNWWKDNFEMPPQSSMQVDSMITSKELVKKGLGYAFFPSICILETDQLHTIDLEQNGSILHRKTSLLYRNELNEISVFNAFIEYTKKFYET